MVIILVCTALILLFINKASKKVLYGISLGGTIVVFILCSLLYFLTDQNFSFVQLLHMIEITSKTITYRFGIFFEVRSKNILFLFLVSFITLILNFYIPKDTEKYKYYLILMIIIGSTPIKIIIIKSKIKF